MIDIEELKDHLRMNWPVFLSLVEKELDGLNTHPELTNDSDRQKINALTANHRLLASRVRELEDWRKRHIAALRDYKA